MAINKVLAGMQDLLTTVGTTQQSRGGTTVNVQGIDVPYAVTDLADMQALDVTVYTYSRVYTSTTSYTDYIYDPNRVDGIPSDTGSGTWIVASDSGSGGGAAIEEPQTLAAGQTIVDFSIIDCAVSAFYICSGSMADRGRLCKPGDFIVVSSTRIQLTDSYPAGTLLLGVGQEFSSLYLEAVPAVSDAANLGDISSLINTANKYTGKMVYDNSTNVPVWADGALATSNWRNATGTIIYTPS